MAPNVDGDTTVGLQAARGGGFRGHGTVGASSGGPRVGEEGAGGCHVLIAPGTRDTSSQDPHSNWVGSAGPVKPVIIPNDNSSKDSPMLRPASQTLWQLAVRTVLNDSGAIRVERIAKCRLTRHTDQQLRHEAAGSGSTHWVRCHMQFTQDSGVGAPQGDLAHRRPSAQPSRADN
ncbi:unnamed protein product [Rangifer tarandus platyrhynchus]|uniref:Uncharacterized protein n=1 Tax=Rangifer tarandus platyrhynchus TaxID=3082113 RepID=A0AC59ZDP7_RANTA